jgi:hypothetical protein
VYGGKAHRKYSLASKEFNQESPNDPRGIPEASKVYAPKLKAERVPVANRRTPDNWGRRYRSKKKGS